MFVPSSRSADTVILLDDTVTTGSTIAAARYLLMQAGARRIGAVALARTVKYYGSITAGAR
jgi:predicted amidophosphoribosyltransferase